MFNLASGLRRLACALLLAGVAFAPQSADAADASCKQLFKLKSKNSATPTTITFINNASTYRAIMWLDFTGHPKDYANLASGQSVTLQTFMTHPWMVATGPGDCIKIVMPRAGGSTERLTDSGGGARKPRVASGEEGGKARGCPPGTVPVPETDNCVLPRKAR